ncbi:hypothetical protein RB623_00990 [Mesorhizobium sp. LHD-90]|uniref:hypothetical protein n=1 Tax=Mesorhizobium sp. LHD-90 TaxID=3071414 RepID=UPI0027E17B7D|nr:hypothetical protein [Mesorhizobium sp. LHD-90]MDQ6432625.1 hypothetical protein [Mesorhizobium sp. LHD-90]
MKRLGWSLIGLLACGCTSYYPAANGDYLLSTTQPGFFQRGYDVKERGWVVDMLARNGASCSARPDEYVTRCAYAYCVDARPKILTWTVGRRVTTRTVRPPKLDEFTSACGPHHLYVLQNAYVARNGATVVSLD